jgi:hypothetical protein
VNVSNLSHPLLSPSCLCFKQVLPPGCLLPAPNTPLLIRRRGGRCSTGTSSNCAVLGGCPAAAVGRRGRGRGAVGRRRRRPSPSVRRGGRLRTPAPSRGIVWRRGGGAAAVGRRRSRRRRRPADVSAHTHTKYIHTHPRCVSVGKMQEMRGLSFKVQISGFRVRVSSPLF